MQLKFTQKGEYHGYVIENLNDVDSNILAKFKRLGWINNKGKIIAPWAL